MLISAICSNVKQLSSYPKLGRIEAIMPSSIDVVSSHPGARPAVTLAQSEPEPPLLQPLSWVRDQNHESMMMLSYGEIFPQHAGEFSRAFQGKKYHRDSSSESLFRELLKEFNMTKTCDVLYEFREYDHLQMYFQKYDCYTKPYLPTNTKLPPMNTTDHIFHPAKQGPDSSAESWVMKPLLTKNECWTNNVS